MSYPEAPVLALAGMAGIGLSLVTCVRALVKDTTEADRSFVRSVTGLAIAMGLTLADLVRTNDGHGLVGLVYLFMLEGLVLAPLALVAFARHRRRRRLERAVELQRR